MEYEIDEEKMGTPTNKVDEDGMTNALAEILDMEKEKIEFFTEQMGLAWLDQPEFVGVTENQLASINELKYILRGMAR
jgi:hypothetical protein